MCVVDDLQNGILSLEDTAEVPKCCHADHPPSTPSVCYSLEISCVPTCDPTLTLPPKSTDDPTAAPSKEPTNAPTPEPTVNPTKSPSTSPTDTPTKGPTLNPTQSPVAAVTLVPTKEICEEKMISDVCVAIDNSGSICTNPGLSQQLCDTCNGDQCQAGGGLASDGLCCGNYESIANFASAYVSTLPSETTFAIVKYGSAASVISPFGASAADATQAIATSPYTGGYTHTEDAILKCVEELKGSENPVIVLITDGTPTACNNLSTDGVSTKGQKGCKGNQCDKCIGGSFAAAANSAATLASNQGATLVPIIISSVATDIKQLEGLARCPANNDDSCNVDDYKGLNVESLDQLDQILDALVLTTECAGNEIEIPTEECVETSNAIIKEVVGNGDVYTVDGEFEIPPVTVTAQNDDEVTVTIKQVFNSNGIPMMAVNYRDPQTDELQCEMEAPNVDSNFELEITSQCVLGSTELTLYLYVGSDDDFDVEECEACSLPNEDDYVAYLLIVPCEPVVCESTTTENPSKSLTAAPTTSPPTDAPTRGWAEVIEPPTSTCECDAGDDHAGSFKCGNDLYVCPGVENICATQGSQNTAFYYLDEEQCNQMKAIELDAKCLALPAQGLDKPRGLSNRVCYDGTNGRFGTKVDSGSCDECQEFMRVPPAPRATVAPTAAPTAPLDCSQLESDVIQDVIALGKDSKNKLFDTIERLQSRLNGAKQCTDSEWRINYGHLSYYKIGDGTPEGVGCRETPFTGMDWPYDTNDKGVNHKDYPAATVREGTCGSGLVLQCTPEPIPAKYSYDRPTNPCPRVYCVTAADPLVAGEYWEDISNFVQDQVPRYIKGAIDTNQECLIPPPPPATETEQPPIDPGSFCHALGVKNGCDLSGPGSCQINPGPNNEPSCGFGVPAGYYPDLNNCNAYCKCTGTTAPSRYEIVNTGLEWDNFQQEGSNYYLPGQMGKDGAWGTNGGGAGRPSDMSLEGRLRPGGPDGKTCGPKQTCPSGSYKSQPWDNCTKWYTCNNGKSGPVQNCPGGLLFRADLGICDWAANVKCN